MIDSSSRSRNARWPRTASSCETTSFERSRHVGREDDVNDVLAASGSTPERSSRRSPPGLRVEPRRPRGRAPSPPAARAGARGRGSPPLARRPPGAARSRPRASRAGAAGCDLPSGGSPTRGSAARPSLSSPRSRIRARRARWLRAPRPRRARTVATGAMTSCAMRIPGSTVNSESRSVFKSTTRISPR